MNLAATTELLTVLSDGNRLRLLQLLDGEELNVAELVASLELPQSRVSTHLGRLKEAGLVVDRREGTQVFYSRPQRQAPGHELLLSVCSTLADDVIAADKRRLTRVRSGQRPLELTYAPGRTFEAYAQGLFSALSLGDVLDAGCGDGAVSALVAQHVRSLTLLDESEQALAAAKKRLSHQGAGKTSLQFRLGDLQAMPFAERSFDTVLLFNVLTCVDEPKVVIREAARVLRPTGRLLIVTLATHSYGSLTKTYAHQHPGFSPKQLRVWIDSSGLRTQHCDITSRQPQEPYFEIVTALGQAL